MSTKFEKLLDYLVNEEIEKADELFHEIVVEKSRQIYENLIAEEEDDDEQQDEGVDSDDDEQQDESVENEQELEDSYMMDADDAESGLGSGRNRGDSTDQFRKDIAPDDEYDDEVDPEDDDEVDPEDDGYDDEEGDNVGNADTGLEGSDDIASDLKNTIAELTALLAKIEDPTALGTDAGDDEEGEYRGSGTGIGDEEGEFGADKFGADNKFGSDDDEEDQMMGMYEGKKRITREYVEKVGNDWEKGSNQKAQGKNAGAGTGDTDCAPNEGNSAVNVKAKTSMPNTGANAGNILGSKGTGEGTNTGTSPNGKTGGLVRNAQQMNTGNGNVPGGKMGVKNLRAVPKGHGAEKKGSTPGPVGSGKGDKAGQTAIAPATKKQFLKPYSQ